jgi:hypothetical protein
MKPLRLLVICDPISSRRSRAFKSTDREKLKMEIVIVTWNLDRQKCSTAHWKELEALNPTLVVFQECKGLRVLPSWVSDKKLWCREWGMAAVVREGTLEDAKDQPGCREFHTWTWKLAGMRPIAVTGVHVKNRGYRKKAVDGLRVLEVVS